MSNIRPRWPVGQGMSKSIPWSPTGFYILPATCGPSFLDAGMFWLVETENPTGLQPSRTRIGHLTLSELLTMLHPFKWRRCGFRVTPLWLACTLQQTSNHQASYGWRQFCLTPKSGSHQFTRGSRFQGEQQHQHQQLRSVESVGFSIA